MSFTYRELQKCAEREIAMRRNVFRSRGMTKTRLREIALMETIREHFKELADDDERAGRNPDGLMNVETGAGGFTLPLYGETK